MTGGGRVAYLLGPERIEWRNQAIPVPGRGEALLRVGAAVTCGTDLKVFLQGGHARMLRPPSPFGHEVAGTIAALGAGVEAWREGDRVAVANSAPCGSCRPCQEGRENLCSDLLYLNGAFADWLLIPARFVERSLHRCPETLPFALAALAEPLACVLHGRELCALRPGRRVLVLGAGPLGLLWTGTLAAEGHQVLLADPNPARLEIGRIFGAHSTIQVERESVAPQLTDFDAAIDCTASASGFETCLRALDPGGVLCVFAGPQSGTEARVNLRELHYGERRIVSAYHYRPPDYASALERIAAGSLPVEELVSATLPLRDLEDALRRMMDRRALKVALVPDLG
ncbi:MAG: alcohol dehydrogenase catalytic domain-containing protein [Acidobacteriota bacterium]